MSNATNADECRLLVDMFLAQAGLPVRAADCIPETSKDATEIQHAVVVETLLSNDSPDITSREIRHKESFSTEPSASESSLPTPKSISHSSMTAVFRKGVPSDFGSLTSPAVLAEA